MKRILLLVAVLLLSACQHEEAPAITGYIEVDTRYIIAPQSGYIESVAIEEGQRVEQGDALLTLDPEQQRIAVEQATAQLEQAEASLSDKRTGARDEEIAITEAQIAAQQARTVLAQHEVDRLIPMVPRQLASQRDLDTARQTLRAETATLASLTAQKKAQSLPARPKQIDAQQAVVNAARQSLSDALWALDRRQLNARFSGQVETLFYRQGEFVTQGRPIASLLNTDWLKVRFFVGAQQLGALSAGQRITLHVPGDATTATATISYLSATPVFKPPILYSEPGSERLSYVIEARLSSSAQLRPGQPVQVTL